MLALTALMGVTSCGDDYFIDPIEQDINQDSIYANMLRAETALNSAYYNIPYNWPTGWSTADGGYRNNPKVHQNIIAALCDEGVSSATWTGAPKMYYTNSLSPDVVGISASGGNRGKIEHIFEEPYYYSRRAWLFLENVESVGDASPEWKAQTSAEARMLIATGYFELMKRYGGVPYLEGSMTGASMTGIETRMPLAQLVNKIDSLIEVSIPDLPHSYSDVDQGRIPRAAAYMLRSRLWLYAASPLFNTDQPYMQMADPVDNNLVCMMSADDAAKRAVWQKCVDYTKEAIDYCESQGYKLVDTGSPKEDYTLATRDLRGNTEVILFSRRGSGFNANYDSNNLYARHLPPPSGSTIKNTGYLSVTQNMVDMYRTTDGMDFELNTTVTNPYTVKAMDPRFYASVIYDNDTFGGATIGLNTPDPLMNKLWITGYIMRKFLHEDQYNERGRKIDAPYFYMRLPELYLNYAEALNELSPGSADIENYLNKTTERVDMPRIGLSGKSQQQVREDIRRERAVEFAFEDQRYFDCRRWKIAQSTIGCDGAPRMGAERQADGTYRVKEVTMHKINTNYVWEDKFYLMPFPRSEINLKLGMVQNPGYN